MLEHPPLNLFGAEVLDDLETAVEEAGRAEIRALVVRAEGKVFPGGVDVNMFDGLSPQDARELALRLFRLSHAVEAFRFPPSRASTASASRPASSSRSPAI